MKKTPIKFGAAIQAVTPLHHVISLSLLEPLKIQMAPLSQPSFHKNEVKGAQKLFGLVYPVGAFNGQT